MALSAPKPATPPSVEAASATPWSIARLHAALLAADSATEVLERACGGPILVRRLAPDAESRDPAILAHLQAGPDAPVTLRTVQLLHNGVVLSDARLWYVASRLPADIATCLAHTAQPFGRVVSRLRLRRTTLAARICNPGEPYALDHQAVLTDPDGQPIALVREQYSRAP